MLLTGRKPHHIAWPDFRGAPRIPTRREQLWQIAEDLIERKGMILRVNLVLRSADERRGSV
jgi:hypothetical protein